MEEVTKRGFDTVLTEAVQHVTRNTVAYGLTLDMDAIDPLDAPGVDVPEDNGIRGADVCQALAGMIHDDRLVATELVEFDPGNDVDGKTEHLLADILAIIARAKTGA